MVTYFLHALHEEPASCGIVVSFGLGSLEHFVISFLIGAS